MKKLLLTILLNVLLLLPVVGWGGGVAMYNTVTESDVVAAADIYVQAEKNDSPVYKAFYDDWDQFVMAVGVFDLAANAPQIVKSIAKISAIPRSFQELRAVANNLPTNAPKSILRAWDEVLGVRVESISTLLAKWDNLTIEEAKNLYTQIAKTEIQGSKVVRNQTEILLEIQQRGITNPYSFAYPIEDYTLSNEAIFVRVHVTNNPNRPWLIAVDDFRQYSTKTELIDKLALPVNPTEISIVKIPEGTIIRKSIAGQQDWSGMPHQNGGGVQYEIIQQQAKLEWFKKFGLLNEFLN